MICTNLTYAFICTLTHRTCDGTPLNDGYCRRHHYILPKQYGMGFKLEGRMMGKKSKFEKLVKKFLKGGRNVTRTRKTR